MTARGRTFPRLLGRARADRGDDGSLPAAVLLIVVATSLSAVLMTSFLGQVAASTSGQDRLHALNAAEAGIDAALAQLRAGVDATGAGDPARLPPCQLTGALTQGSGSTQSPYSVVITYQNASGATLSTCPPNSIPATARLQSTGAGVAGGALTVGARGTRTITATYTFRTTNTNIPGGLVRVSTNDLCLDAGAVLPPPAGTRVRVDTCQSGAARQRFAYDEKLRLRLVDANDPTGLGMCVTGDANVLDSNVTFAACVTGSRTQVWSLDDSSRFRGLRSPANTTPHRCLTVEPPVVATAGVIVSACGGGIQTLRPDDEVGAGRAGDENERLITGQIVNYEQFGRCLDVTNFVWDSDYMIAWFCKQEPAPAIVRWNQRWITPAIGATDRIMTVNDELLGRPTYCLRSPGNTDPQSFVTLATCTAAGALAQNLRWTMYGDTGNYATSYQVVDGYGYCLAPTDLTNTYAGSRHSDGTAKVKVEVCNGSDLQKWNARPDLKDPSPLTNVVEK